MNSYIPTLALAGMIVMACAAPTLHIRYKDLAHLIHEEAKNESKHVLQNETIAKISSNGITCVKEFFCLAEKALNNTRLKHSKLNRFLHEYNIQNKNVPCSNHLSKTKQQLKQLLIDIENCTKHTVNKKE